MNFNRVYVRLIFLAVFSFFWRANIYRFQNNGCIWLESIKTGGEIYNISAYIEIDIMYSILIQIAPFYVQSFDISRPFSKGSFIVPLNLGALSEFP